MADGFEEIEGLCVVDILKRALIDVDMVSISDSLTVTGAHGIKITADKLIDEVDFDKGDMIVLPGGMPGTTNLGNCKKLVDNIIKYNKQDKMLAAICAAPSVLGVNGILAGKTATCYPGFEDKLIDACVTNTKVVKSKNVITSRGMGTAIDFGLCIVEYYMGKGKAKELASGIQYQYYE